MKFIKKLTPIILTLMIVLVLSACGSALEKPTGLENNQDQSTSQVEKKDSEKQENKKAEKKEQQKEKESESKKTSKDDKKVKEKPSEDDSKIEDNAKKKENKKNASSKKSKQSSQTNNQTEVKEKTKSDSKPNAQKQKKSEKKSSQSKTESKPKPKPAPKPEPKKAAVTQSIVISSSEVPLSNAKTEIKDGDTILDALIKVTRDKGIQMDYRGGQGSGAYVEGIANVYEFDRGQGSGWMIRINGVFPNRGVGTIPVYDGDNIEWLYTTDLGEDLGANLQPFR